MLVSFQHCLCDSSEPFSSQITNCYRYDVERILAISACESVKDSGQELKEGCQQRPRGATHSRCHNRPQLTAELCRGHQWYFMIGEASRPQKRPIARFLERIKICLRSMESTSRFKFLVPRRAKKFPRISIICNHRKDIFLLLLSTFSSQVIV